MVKDVGKFRKELKEWLLRHCRDIDKDLENPSVRGRAFENFCFELLLQRYNFSDDLGRGFGPFIIGSLLVAFFGRNIAFNIASIFWVICGCLILMMIKTFPKDHSGEIK